MARDAALLTVRNQEILAEFNRLSALRYPVKSGQKSVSIRLTYGQKLQVLQESFFLSVRTLENIIAAAQGVHAADLAPLRSAAA